MSEEVQIGQVFKTRKGHMMRIEGEHRKGDLLRAVQLEDNVETDEDDLPGRRRVAYVPKGSAVPRGWELVE